MINQKTNFGFGLVILFWILTGCRTAPSGTNQPNGSPPLASETRVVSATETPTLPPPTLTPTLIPTSPTPSPTQDLPCAKDMCTYNGHFWMSRPISSTNYDHIDSTYRYGSTQEGARPTHHGVEFVNPEGTPVLAAADGLVIVAGNDYQETYANFPFYYGGLVIIEHHFPDEELPVYSLYGHLSAVQVQAGISVQAGDQIGAVGYTGAAEWSHLHFEVRVGSNTYRDTRNPELWLKPHTDNQDIPNGAIVGRILDEFGTPIYIPNVVVEKIGPDDSILETWYVETYADFSVNGDTHWGENFAIGDLAPGLYRVSFVARGLQTWEINVFSATLSMLTFDARDP